MMKLCWQQDPAKRPTFAKLNKQIDQHLEEVAGYMNIETCLFPEMKHHQVEAKKKRSSSLLTPKKNVDLNVDKQAISISVVSPNGSKNFLQ